jgi:hypothetical protein
MAAFLVCGKKVLSAVELHATCVAADESNRQKMFKVGVGGDDGHARHDERTSNER